MNWRQLKLPLKKNKLFLKILLYFISLLIPIVIIGLFVYLNVDQLMKKDVSEKLSDNLSSSAKTIEIYLGMAQSANSNLLLSDIIQQYLKPYSTLTDDEKVKMPFIVRAIAGNRNIISSFIDNIFMYIDDERVYQGDGVVNFDTFFDKFYQFDQYNKDYWREKLKSDSFFELLAPSKVAISYNNSIHEVIPSITTQYLNGHLATMVTTISIPAITETLQNNSIYGSTAYFILDHKNRLILNSGGLSTEVMQQVKADFQSGNPHAHQLKLSHLNEMITHITSETFGWEYYSVTPIHSFNKEPSSILNLIFWICISLILIGILFSFIFSMSLYNPIKNIRDILVQNEKEGDIHSKFNGGEFQMIGSRINQLVQQNLDATQKLDKFSNEMLDQFFTNLMKGHQWVQQETSVHILDEIGFQNGNYMCCCFMFQFRERFYHDIEEADRLLILEKMKKVLWGIMQQYVKCYMLEYEPNLYMCMVNLEQPNDRERLNQAVEKIKLTFQYDMIYCELVIGLGKVYPQVGDFAKSYSDAITAIDKRTASSELVILDAADLVIEQNYFYSFLDENKVVNCLKSGDLDCLSGEVEGMIRFNKARGVSFHYLGALLVELFNTGNRYITEKGLNIYTFLNGNEYVSLNQKELLPNELDERIKLLFNFYERIITETVFKPERKSGTVISLITAYIENNYAKDLYLEVIADEIGLSAKYISRMFKETTGTSITDYISLIRIAKAKELLGNTDLKISEIADQIGIFSRTTFLRLFKKYEGISPIEYRNANVSKD
ncbi:MAG: AraC family transcriptional regulator [Bacilli bacterium]|jgi:two-component system response regulator YesN|nr:AraC family transcriptional regulator [Bacilli bacterium]